MDFKKSLHPCVVDESRLSIGRVDFLTRSQQNYHILLHFIPASKFTTGCPQNVTLHFFLNFYENYKTKILVIPTMMNLFHLYPD